MAFITANLRVKDSEENSPLSSVPLTFLDTVPVATVAAATQLAAQLLDPVIGGQIVSADMTLPITVTGLGNKTAPIDLYTNERGGLITFDTSGPRASSVRLPAILQSIMPGNSFAVGASPVADLVAFLASTQTVGGVTFRVQTPEGHIYVTARRGVKSIRK